LVAALFRCKGKTKFHLPALNVGMMATGYRRSNHDDLPVRLCEFFRAAKAAAETGLRDLSEASQAKQRIEERLRRTRTGAKPQYLGYLSVDDVFELGPERRNMTDCGQQIFRQADILMRLRFEVIMWNPFGN
jgi:hypothetical protein